MKPYAILILKNLKIRKFDHKDDVAISCEALEEGTYEVLHWNGQTRMYVRVDTCPARW
jgi:hypothetical protein